jgi:hypothetical protein
MPWGEIKQAFGFCGEKKEAWLTREGSEWKAEKDAESVERFQGEPCNEGSPATPIDVGSIMEHGIQKSVEIF